MLNNQLINTKWYLCLILLTFMGCADLKYVDDYGMVNSAQANVMEYPVFIGDKICKDMEDNLGFCSKQQPNNQDVVIKIKPQLYNYQYRINCSSSVGFEEIKDVLANKEALIVIPKEKFQGLLNFTCGGDITPSDRKEKVSAKFRISFSIFDGAYKKREEMYFVTENKKDYLVLGQNAKYSTVCMENECKMYKEKTTIKIKSRKGIFAISESAVMRFNKMVSND